MSLVPLLGVPGALQILKSRLSSARAALLDNLDASVSSRAPASTAVSNVQLTNARIANLDNLDGLVASRLDVPVSSVGTPALTRHAEVVATYDQASTVDPLVVNLGASFDEGKTLLQFSSWNVGFSAPNAVYPVWYWSSASQIRVLLYRLDDAFFAGGTNDRLRVTAVEFTQ